MKHPVITGCLAAAFATATVTALADDRDRDDQAVTRTPIKHLIVIFQENRSFDSYFGTFPGAEGFPRDAKGEIRFCHTLNNTVVASPRILIPILELYQQKDGSVVVPKALRPWMGGLELIEPRG